MKPEEFKIGIKFEYKGKRCPTHLGVVQTITDVKGKYKEIYTDFVHKETPPPFDEFFDADSEYAENCILIKQ